MTTHHIPVPNTVGVKGTHKIAVYDWGNPESQKVTVCVHGLTRNARDFYFLAGELAATGRRVLALSMAGRGESEWLADPMGYNYASYVADCLAVLDNFHLREVEWIGTSMGGIIGMMITAQQPRRIKKLVMNDIGALLSKDALTRIYEYVRTMPKSFASRAEADAYLREIFKPWGIVPPAAEPANSPLAGESKRSFSVSVGGQSSEDTPHQIAKGDLAPPQGGSYGASLSDNAQTLWSRFVDTSLIERDGALRYACDPAIAVPLAAGSKNFTEVADVNLSPIWSEIQTPTLILRGANSDILSEETVTAMRATNLNTQSVTYPNVGHAPALMTKADTQPILDWLDRSLSAMMAVSF